MHVMHVTGTYSGISKVCKIFNEIFVLQYAEMYVPSLALRLVWLPLQKVQHYHDGDFGTEDLFDYKFLWDYPKHLTNIVVMSHRLSVGLNISRYLIQ